MSRFLICSFALVLLYPAGIDMYLVGLPRIAADLNGDTLDSIRHATPPLESVEIVLCGEFLIALIVVVPAFCVHIVHHADGQQV